MARPIKFGGTTLRPDSEFDYYIDRQVVEGTWKQPHDASNCDAVKRLWHAVRGTPLEPGMREGLYTLLTNPHRAVTACVWEIINGSTKTFNEATATEDLSRLVHQHLSSGFGTAWPAWNEFFDPYDYYDGVADAWLAVRKTVLAEPMRRALFAALADADPKVRAGAFAAVESDATGFDAVALLKMLDERPELFRKTPSVLNYYKSLYWQALRLIAGLNSKDPLVLGRLRQEVMDRENGSWILAGLTNSDATYVLANAHEITQGDQNRISIILNNLRTSAQRQTYVASIAPDFVGMTKAVAEKVTHMVHGPEQEDLIARLTRS